MKLIRPLVERLHPYVPGEQPKIPGLIKLNTNENPYPPAPKVLQAVRAAVDGRLRLYPNPAADTLRAALAKYHRCKPENIIIGNGSDELLPLAIKAFCEPVPENPPLPHGRKISAHTVQYFHPSYSLYPVLADIHGAVSNPVKLRSDFSLPPLKQLQREGEYDFNAAVTFITTPNAPSGRGYSTKELNRLCKATQGIVVLDEAYVDFAEENAATLAFRHKNVIVSRTFSKAFSLCFQRVGYFLGPIELISALHKMRDSYNVNGLGQVAAVETLKNLSYYRANFAKINATRSWLATQLTKLGFDVLPSQTNFILAKPPGKPAESWLGALRDRKILVRWFKQPEVKDYLRITIGTQSEAQALVKACKNALNRQ